MQHWRVLADILKKFSLDLMWNKVFCTLETQVAKSLHEVEGMMEGEIFCQMFVTS
jgi:hypothetical protein